MALHVRTDSDPDNKNRRFACGIGPELPPGDQWVAEIEYHLHRLVTCEVCRKHVGSPSRELGTPLSELSGRPGAPGYAKFKDIATSWGYP